MPLFVITTWTLNSLSMKFLVLGTANPPDLTNFQSLTKLKLAAMPTPPEQPII